MSRQEVWIISSWTAVVLSLIVLCIILYKREKLTKLWLYLLLPLGLTSVAFFMLPLPFFQFYLVTFVPVIFGINNLILLTWFSREKHSLEQRIVSVILVFIFFVFGYYRLFFANLTYNPHINPSPIHSLTVPDVIYSVYNLPYERNLNYRIDARLSYAAQKIESHETALSEEVRLYDKNNSVSIELSLYSDKFRALEKYWGVSGPPPPTFTEEGTQENQYLLSHIVRSRQTGFEGMNLPQDNYFGDATFLKNNLVIQIRYSSNSKEGASQAANDAIKYIGLLLKRIM